MKLKPGNLKSRLLGFIEAADREIKERKIPKPITSEDKKHNSKLYNKKANGIRSILRDGFSELGLTEDQCEWLQGRLELKVDDKKVTLGMYSKQQRAERYKKSNLAEARQTKKANAKKEKSEWKESYQSQVKRKWAGKYCGSIRD